MVVDSCFEECAVVVDEEPDRTGGLATSEGRGDFGQHVQYWGVTDGGGIPLAGGEHRGGVGSTENMNRLFCVTGPCEEGQRIALA